MKPDLRTLSRPFVLLEDRLSLVSGGRLFSHPVKVARCDEPEAVAAALDEVQAGLDAGLHAAGFLSYELGYALEPKLASRMPGPRSGPLLWLGLFAGFDVVSGDALDEAFAALGPPPPISEVAYGHDQALHVAKVLRILDLIRSGDIYQTNLTFPIQFRCGGDPLALYGALRVQQPVSHGGVVALEDMSVLSVSPELFVEVADGEATTRPMKGTAARGADPRSDEAARRALAGDPKQRAENLMIVDLLRNDLGRISQPGSVRTPALFTVETYPTFHTMTSTVTARLKPDLGLKEKLAALFPCGSIVGAPKIRAAEVIREIEAAPRGVYTGAVGHLAPGGDMRFNVAIRTAVVSADGAGIYGVGGGVVADSDPGGEYDEALLKAKALTGLATDYGLIETFRWSPGSGFQRVTLHLDRLAKSARALDFAFDRAEAEALLVEHAAGWGVDSDRRVRLLLARDGALELTEQPIPARSDAPVTLCIADRRLDAGDPYLRYKTTRRDAFEAAATQAVREGVDEAVLLNRAARVADASRNSVFAEIGGRLLTPPLTAGALPGVLRAELIAEARAVEAELTLPMLRTAERCFVGNSLHGLRLARLV